MRRVLVTGSSGQVGAAACAVLEAAGWNPSRFDLVEGQDVRDGSAVFDAAAGCEAIVHAGAIAHDSAGTPDEIVATNVLGTWHVLSAAEAHGVDRLVYFSSGQVFGFADGEGTPDSFPINDSFPLRAARPYGMSKRLAEAMCEMWTARTGISTVVLRPVMILDDATLARTNEADVEFGAFVHVDDVAAAVRLALESPIEGHVRMILCGPGPFDTSVAETTLGWRPTRAWQS